MSEMKYRPEIDGLRTIAVIPVILFHLGVSWINGGYFGVDVFFVISGFLISSIILKNIYSNTFSFKDFWLRRVRRIVPALLIMVISTLIGAYFLAFKLNLPSYGSDGLSAIFSYANFAMRAKGNYLGSTAESSPFLHCWSLSVEEQFYLLYPLLIFLLYKIKVSISKSLVIITVLSFFAFMAASIYFPRTGFYILPTRAWELAAGGLLSYFSLHYPLSRMEQERYKFVPVFGLVLILISFFFPITTNGIGIMAVFPVMGSVLIIKYVMPGQMAGKILAHPAMVVVGKISYSLYLWHWPIIVIAKQLSTNNELSIQASIVVLLLTFILATVSYELVEKTTRTKKHIFRIVVPMATVAVILCICCVIPLVNIYYTSTFEKKASYDFSYFITPADAEHGIPGGDTSVRKSAIIVVGDSHGAVWCRQIDEIAKASGVKVSFFTMKGENPLESDYQTAILESLEKNAPCLVIICCKWDDRDQTPIKELIIYGEANHTNFLLINQPPMLPPFYENTSTNMPQFLSYKKFFPKANQPQYTPAYLSKKVEKKNDELFALSRAYSNCSYLNIYNFFAKGDSVQVISGNKVLYYDDDHLSNQGTEMLKPVLQKAILANLKNSAISNFP